jgi:hypothetical protein
MAPTGHYPTLREIAQTKVLSITRLVNAYQDATLADWEQARADSEAFFVHVPQMVRGLEAAFGENALGLGIFTRLPFDSGGLAFRALGVAGLLVLRRAGYGKELDGFFALAREQGPLWERRRTLLAALKEEIPAVGAALTIDARQLGAPGAFEEYLQSLAEIAKPHENELNAFWARHLDLHPDAIEGGASLPEAS